MPVNMPRGLGYMYVKELITPYQPNYSGLRSSSDSRMLTSPKLI